MIFESGHGVGLYRYLLTMLDGLESATAGEVCVMMTVMDVTQMPKALIRSGRIELWLETRLPNEAARSDILTGFLQGLPAPFDEVDIHVIASMTEGFTGADLKRLSEDGKTLYAYDKLRAGVRPDITNYFLTAIEGVRSNKRHYAFAESRAKSPKQEDEFETSGYAH